MSPSPPKQWHLYAVALEPRVGTKPGKQRPCIAIQPSVFAENGLPSTIIIPLTSQLTPKPAFPLRVSIPRGVCSLEYDSEALIDQILAWDNRLFLTDLGQVPEAVEQDVKAALQEFLDL